jgi:hypothetical protein
VILISDYPFVRKLLPQHADGILAYAAKHNYPDTLDLAASSVLKMPLHEVVALLPTNLVVPWVTRSYTSPIEKMYLTPLYRCNTTNNGIKFGKTPFLKPSSAGISRNIDSAAHARRGLRSTSSGS